MRGIHGKAPSPVGVTRTIGSSWFARQYRPENWNSRAALRAVGSDARSEMREPEAAGKAFAFQISHHFRDAGRRPAHARIAVWAADLIRPRTPRIPRLKSICEPG